MRKHYVTFLSPGTMMSEETARPISSWSVPAAADMAKTIIERYNAKPYGFYFSTVLSADPVPDGEGGVLQVLEKEVERSGTYFLTGRLIKVEDVPPSTLRSNMECNDWPLCVENCNSYRMTQRFEEKDFIVDWDGTILERGDNPRHVAYRARMIERHRKEMARV